LAGHNLSPNQAVRKAIALRRHKCGDRIRAIGTRQWNRAFVDALEARCAN
jgi:hypothetical protein